MEAQRTPQPQPFQQMPSEAPGQMVYQPRAMNPAVMAKIRAEIAPYEQLEQKVRPNVAPGKKDYTPLYVGAGLFSVLAVCGTVMVAIANSPNAQTERVATTAVQSSALVAKEVAERPTCRAVGLIVMRGACPDPSAASEKAPQPVNNSAGAVPYTQVINQGPLPAELPAQGNPYLGMDNPSLQTHWNNNGCNVDSTPMLCTQILEAANHN
jgi:hypothetical protein